MRNTTQKASQLAAEDNRFGGGIIRGTRQGEKSLERGRPRPLLAHLSRVRLFGNS
jgi:hypothetical protein